MNEDGCTEARGKKTDFVISAASLAIVVAVITALASMDLVHVDGVSMEPALADGKWLKCVRVDSGTDLSQGDIVTARIEGRGTVIKRVIACPGDTVGITDGQYVVNGKEYREESSSGKFGSKGRFPAISDAGILSDGKEITLGKGEYFLSGDNRDESLDSRSFGPVGIGRITRKAVPGRGDE